jgi:hypothetical protein
MIQVAYRRWQLTLALPKVIACQTTYLLGVFISHPAVHIALTTKEQSFRRKRDMDCRMALLVAAEPGDYTLYINDLIDGGFKAVVKKD